MNDKPENWDKGFDHPWKIGCGGNETPFISNNKWWLYMWNCIEKDHYYYCYDDDLFTKEVRERKMETFSVLLSDGENEWWATMKAKSLEHLYDLIDADGYDVVETRLEN